MDNILNPQVEEIRYLLGVVIFVLVEKGIITMEELTTAKEEFAKYFYNQQWEVIKEIMAENGIPVKT